MAVGQTRFFGPAIRYMAAVDISLIFVTTFILVRRVLANLDCPPIRSSIIN